MIQYIIDFFRREADMSILDLTLDICSTSMYYFFLRGEKNLTKEKINALINRLGRKALTETEIDYYQESLKNLILHRYDYVKFCEEAEQLLPNRKNILFEEKLTINYLLFLSFYYHAIREPEKGLPYLEILNQAIGEFTPMQKVQYFIIKSGYNQLDAKEAKAMLKQAERILSLESANETPEFGTLFLYIAKSYNQIRCCKLCELNLQIALNIFRKYDDFYGIVKTLNIQGELAITRWYQPDTLPFLEENLLKAKLINNPFDICKALTNLFYYYNFKNDSRKVDQLFSEIKPYIVQSKTKFFRDEGLINILVILEKYELGEEMNFVISLIKENRQFIKDSFLQKALYYFSIQTEEERNIFKIEKMLPLVLEKSNFSLCQGLLTDIISHYEMQKCYKKTSYYQKFYIDLLKEFYC